jgi:hypothetical protein
VASGGKYFSGIFIAVAPAGVLFFFSERFLEIDLPKLNAMRAQRPERLPVAMLVEIVRVFLAELDGIARVEWTRGFRRVQLLGD